MESEEENQINLSNSLNIKNISTWIDVLRRYQDSFPSDRYQDFEDAILRLQVLKEEIGDNRSQFNNYFSDFFDKDFDYEFMKYSFIDRQSVQNLKQLMLDIIAKKQQDSKKRMKKAQQQRTLDELVLLGIGKWSDMKDVLNRLQLKAFKRYLLEYYKDIDSNQQVYNQIFKDIKNDEWNQQFPEWFENETQQLKDHILSNIDKRKDYDDPFFSDDEGATLQKKKKGKVQKKKKVEEQIPTVEQQLPPADDELYFGLFNIADQQPSVADSSNILRLSDSIPQIEPYQPPIGDRLNYQLIRKQNQNPQVASMINYNVHRNVYWNLTASDQINERFHQDNMIQVGDDFSLNQAAHTYNIQQLIPQTTFMNSMNISISHDFLYKHYPNLYSFKSQIKKNINIVGWTQYIQEVFNENKDANQRQMVNQDQETLFQVNPSIRKMGSNEDVHEIIFTGIPMSYELDDEIVTRLIGESNNQLNNYMIDNNRIKLTPTVQNINQQLTSNYTAFKNMISAFIDKIGHKQDFSRIWISFEVIGIKIGFGIEMESVVKLVSSAYGISPVEYSNTNNTSVVQFQKKKEKLDKETFIEDLLAKLNYMGETYEMIPIYIQNIQIFVAQQKQMPTGSFQDMLQRMANVGIYRQRMNHHKMNRISKRIQLIDNLYSICHQRYAEPCLYTVYRYVMKCDKEWSKINLSSEIRNIIKQGQFAYLIDYFIQEYDFKDFGIFFFHSQRWWNQLVELQFIIISNHVIVSNRENIERLVYTEFYNRKNIRYVLNPKDEKQLQKQLQIPETLEFYLDIETYTTNDKQQIPQLVILYQNPNTVYQFWGEQCIMECLQKISSLAQTANLVKIWTFNGSSFDTIFFFKVLQKVNEDFNLIGTIHNIKQLIWQDKIKFQDLRLIFNYGGLAQQAKLWKISEDKQDFDIKNKSLQWFQDNKNDIIKYCIQDCHVLMKLVQKFYQLCEEISYNNKKLSYHNIFTSAQLSMEIFQQLYQDQKLYAPLNISIYKIIRGSYFGGCTQVIEKFGQNISSYDINNSYGHILYKKKFPIEVCRNDIYRNEKIRSYYLYLVEIKFKNDVKIPYIPQRKSDGLYYTLYIKQSWRWGIDIKFGLKHNLFEFCRIARVITFTVGQPFHNFVHDINNKRQLAKQQDRSDLDNFYKLIVNSLYGKTGQNPFPEVKFCNSSDLSQYLSSDDLPLFLNKKRSFLNNDLGLVYKEVQSIRRIDDESFQIQYAEKEKLNGIFTLVQFAALTTRYACIELMKGVYDILNKGGNVYYMDTDSIYTDMELSPHFLHMTELGKWKKEGVYKKGIFPAPKIYLTTQNEFQGNLKAKGINKTFWVEQNDKSCKIVVSKKGEVQGDSLLYAEQFISSLLDDQKVKIHCPNYFQKKKIDNIYVINQQKMIQQQNKKRQWIGYKSNPFEHLP